MRKGITPVIAMILLILIVVALGGVFAAWTTRSWEQLGETGEQQIQQVSGQLQRSITIDTVDCSDPGTVYVRNSGSVDITCAEMSVYIDNVRYDTACTDDPLTEGSVTDLTGSGGTDYNLDAATAGADIRVRVTVSGNSATYTCRA